MVALDRYRYIAADPEQDEKRTDPASFVARLMAGKLDLGELADSMRPRQEANPASRWLSGILGGGATAEPEQEDPRSGFAQLADTLGSWGGEATRYIGDRAGDIAKSYEEFANLDPWEQRAATLRNVPNALGVLQTEVATEGAALKSAVAGMEEAVMPDRPARTHPSEMSEEEYKQASGALVRLRAGLYHLLGMPEDEARRAAGKEVSAQLGYQRQNPEAFVSLAVGAPKREETMIGALQVGKSPIEAREIASKAAERAAEKNPVGTLAAELLAPINWPIEAARAVGGAVGAAKAATGLGAAAIGSIVGKGAKAIGAATPEARAIALARSPIGDKTSAFGITNPRSTYDFRWRVASLDDLIPSNNDAFEKNPLFPEGAQPRERGRAINRLQVDNIAQDLYPPQLIEDMRSLDKGAPIIGDDLAVESGNGRVLGLRLARDAYPERWAEYQEALRAKLPEYGIDPGSLAAVPDPVLVRERITPVADRRAFAAEANASVSLGMSTQEQAVEDARKLSDRVLEALVVSDRGTIDTALLSPANERLVNHFLANVPKNERPALHTEAGPLSQTGLARLRAALLAKAYGGESGARLAQSFNESLDPGIERAKRAVFRSLPDVAGTEALIAQGLRAEELSITEDVSKALNTLASLRADRTKVAEYLARPNLPTMEHLSDFQRYLLYYLDQPGVTGSPKPLSDALRAYAADVKKLGSAEQEGMETLFAMEEVAQPTKEEIFARIAQAQREGKEVVGPGATRAEKEAAAASLAEVPQAGTAPPKPEKPPAPPAEVWPTVDTFVPVETREGGVVWGRGSGLHDATTMSPAAKTVLNDALKKERTESPRVSAAHVREVGMKAGADRKFLDAMLNSDESASARTVFMVARGQADVLSQISRLAEELASHRITQPEYDARLPELTATLQEVTGVFNPLARRLARGLWAMKLGPTVEEAENGLKALGKQMDIAKKAVRGIRQARARPNGHPDAETLRRLEALREGDVKRAAEMGESAGGTTEEGARRAPSRKPPTGPVETAVDEAIDAEEDRWLDWARLWVEQQRVLARNAPEAGAREALVTRQLRDLEAELLPALRQQVVDRLAKQGTPTPPDPDEILRAIAARRKAVLAGQIRSELTGTGAMKEVEKAAKFQGKEDERAFRDILKAMEEEKRAEFASLKEGAQNTIRQLRDELKYGSASPGTVKLARDLINDIQAMGGEKAWNAARSLKGIIERAEALRAADIEREIAQDVSRANRISARERLVTIDRYMKAATTDERRREGEKLIDQFAYFYGPEGREEARRYRQQVVNAQMKDLLSKTEKELPKEKQAARIDQLAREFARVDTSDSRAVNRFLASVARVNASQYAHAYRVGSILGPPSIALQAVGGLLEAGFAYPDRFNAAAIEALATQGGRRRPRAAVMAQVSDELVGHLQSLGPGLAQMAKTIQTGVPARPMRDLYARKTDYFGNSLLEWLQERAPLIGESDPAKRRATVGRTKILENTRLGKAGLPGDIALTVADYALTPLNTTFRLLAGLSDFVRELNTAGVELAEARATASVRGIPLESVLANLTDHPEVMKRSTTLIEKRNYEDRLKGMLDLLGRMRGMGGAAGETVKQTLPFFQSLASIVAQGFAERTPYYFLKGGTERAVRWIDRLPNPEGYDPAAVALARGRAMTGTQIMLGGFVLAELGQIVAYGPDDPKEQDDFHEQGGQSFSLLVPKQGWFDYLNAGGALAIPLALGASLSEARRKTFDPKKKRELMDRYLDFATELLIKDTGSLFLRESAIKGMADVFNTIADPARYGPRFLERFIGSYAPASGWTATAARVESPVIRDPEGLTEYLMSRIPGLQEQVPERITRLGEAQRRAISGPLALLPLRMNELVSSPIYEEYSRLRKAGQDVGLRDFSGSKYGDVEQTREQRDLIQRTMGQRASQYLATYIQMPAYSRLSDAGKANTLKDALEVAYELADLDLGDSVARDDRGQAKLAWAAVPHYQAMKQDAPAAEMRRQNFEIAQARAKLANYKERYKSDYLARLRKDDPAAAKLAVIPPMPPAWLRARRAEIDKRFGGALLKAEREGLLGTSNTVLPEQQAGQR